MTDVEVVYDSELTLESSWILILVLRATWVQS